MSRFTGSMRISFVACFITGLMLFSAETHAQRQQREAPPKTYTDIAYAPYESTRLDFWQAPSLKPTPLVIYIHGGGFTGGSKDRVNAGMVQDLLKAGISFASVEYRPVGVAPLPAAHEDCTRAIQFLRSKAQTWNLDKDRFGATGGSAGAQLCLYLAFHDDMADRSSDDPLKRESTRLTCAAVGGCQITMDLDWWIKNIPEYTVHKDMFATYGVTTDAELKPLIRETSVVNHLTQDDPPVWMSYGMAPGDPVPEDKRKAGGWKVHHVNFGVEMQKQMKNLGLEMHLSYPGATPEYKSSTEFFIAKLKE